MAKAQLAGKLLSALGGVLKNLLLGKHWRVVE
jgi:hypothetical protein